jgi:hypothetical protein
MPEGQDDAELERRLFPVADFNASGRPAIDWPVIQYELKRRSVTLALLWQEYLAEHPNGYSHTRFTALSGPKDAPEFAKTRPRIARAIR